MELKWFNIKLVGMILVKWEVACENNTYTCVWSIEVLDSCRQL